LAWLGIWKPGVGLADADAGEATAGGDDPVRDVAGAVAVAGGEVGGALLAVVIVFAAVMLATHRPSARRAPVSRVMMGDLSFTSRTTSQFLTLIQLSPS
jgi:hypothetical protein